MLCHINESLALSEYLLDVKISCQSLVPLSLSQYWYWLLFRKPLHLCFMNFLVGDQERKTNLYIWLAVHIKGEHA